MSSMNKILFEKPDLAKLRKKYVVFDMHFHTNYSDGLNTVEAIANHARKLGIGIGITDHNEIRGAVEIDKYKKILSIPGIEVTSQRGTHILIYFYNIDDLKAFYHNDVIPHMGKDIMSSISLKLEEIIQRARQFNTVIIFPHPYSAVYTGICNYNSPPQRLDKLFEMVDGVEVINSGNLNKWNLQCAVLGFNLGKAIIGGSDGHSLSHMGHVVSCAPCKKDRRAFLDAIANKEVRVIGKEINLLRKVSSNSLKLKTSLKYSPEKIGRNILYGYTVLNSKSKVIRDNVKRSVKGKIKKRFPQV